MRIVDNSRVKRLKLNIISSLSMQMVVLFCNLVIPQQLILAFGSESYGATISIAKFLSLIALAEGGVIGVTRAALYKPLADNDIQRISEIVAETKKFYHVIAYIFIGYTLILACSFKYIARADFEWIFTFILVIAISIATFAQYFIGIVYAALLDAAQKTYIPKISSIISWIISTAAVILLIRRGHSLIVIKLVSSVIFLLQPIGMWLYVKKHFKLIKCDAKGKNYLAQKWDGLGQHLAYHLHFQTDIAVLTLFTNLSLVAVYSVYNMIISYMQNIIGSFAAGMEALFGEMLAKEEHETLKKTFDFYETMISIIAITLFSITAVMIVSFVELYTSGITDANYKQPLFALILVLASVIYCLRLPYHELTIAAGHFKQTNKAAYGEAAINVILSIILLRPFGLCGVALATVIATSYRFLYYVVYLSKNIINRKKSLFLKRMTVNGCSIMAAFLCGSLFLSVKSVPSYFYWAFYAVFVTLIAVFVVFLFYMLFYRRELFMLWKKMKKR